MVCARTAACAAALTAALAVAPAAPAAVSPRTAGFESTWSPLDQTNTLRGTLAIMHDQQLQLSGKCQRQQCTDTSGHGLNAPFAGVLKSWAEVAI